jgi:hypothetical protein
MGDSSDSSKKQRGRLYTLDKHIVVAQGNSRKSGHASTSVNLVYPRQAAGFLMKIKTDKKLMKKIKLIEKELNLSRV